MVMLLTGVLEPLLKKLAELRAKYDVPENADE